MVAKMQRLDRKEMAVVTGGGKVTCSKVMNRVSFAFGAAGTVIGFAAAAAPPVALVAGVAGLMSLGAQALKFRYC